MTETQRGIMQNVRKALQAGLQYHRWSLQILSVQTDLSVDLLQGVSKGEILISTAKLSRIAEALEADEEAFYQGQYVRTRIRSHVQSVSGYEDESEDFGPHVKVSQRDQSPINLSLVDFDSDVTLKEAIRLQKTLTKAIRMAKTWNKEKPS